MYILFLFFFTKYMCVSVCVCVLCKYKHMHTYCIYLRKICYVYILNIFIYNIKYKNINI